jgi:hypothetical protein
MVRSTLSITFSSPSSDFRVARDLAAESWSLGSMPSAISCSMKAVRHKNRKEYKVSPEHDSGVMEMEGSK